MTLSAGTNLGAYQIVSPLGAGGMGEVYLARDTKLDRYVAIKVLPEALSQDEERLARFEREAKLLAQLNHANIATLHGLEESEGRKFLVMELVEGETLAEQIARGPIPHDEAQPLFIQIAEGLEAAHEKSIIHRDLKPANIKITPDGKVKILDFGLAKAFAPQESDVEDSSRSPTLTKGTALGAIMGTASYMSPEQARGKPVDKRTDIWAFGCCLYEALTGKKAFDGETVSDIIGAVLHKEPNWVEIPSGTPRRIRQLLNRILEKNTRNRLHDIADARIEIESLTHEASPEANRPAARSPFMNWAPWTLASVLALIAAMALWQRGTILDEKMVQRYEIELPRASAGGLQVSLSPDGKFFAYTGVGRDGAWSIYLRPLGEFEARQVEGTAGGEYPFFSPDSRWLGFHSYGEMRKVPVEGGTPAVICETAEAIGSTWGPQGDIVFGLPNDGLHRVSADGGERTRLTDPKDLGGEAHLWPRFLPDGRSVIFTVWRGSEPAQVAFHSLVSGTSRVLVQGAAPRYAHTGHLLFWHNDALRAVTFDSTTGSITGEPREVLPALGGGFYDNVFYEIAETGHLVYSAAEPFRQANSELIIVDSGGGARAFANQTADRWIQPQYSPSGTRIAYVRATPKGATYNISVYDTRSRRSVPLIPALDPFLATWPVWSPNEKWIAFVSNLGSGINTVRASADGGGVVEQLTFESHLRTIPSSWSVDGFLAVERGSNNQRDILILPMGNGVERKLEPFLVTDFNERQARFSPDGRWLAFTSDRSGQDEVWVTSYPEGGAPILVSLGGGKEASWAGDGRRLFYRRGDEMWAVPVQATGESFEVGEPELLFRGDYSYGYIDWALNYSVSPDGQSFLMVKDGPPPEFRVVVNWFQELKRLVPSDN